MSFGVVVPRVFGAEASVATPDDAYVHELAERYGLSSAQQRLLRLVLQSARDEEFAIYASAETAQLPDGIRRELLVVRSRTEQRIRALLDDRQRAQFDVDSRPQDVK
ncbi:MAG: hypothetical protein JNL08_07655 [Planctomycetes bacterium]|nr:hypothetical protein [Planctomycetota bacterium]